MSISGSSGITVLLGEIVASRDSTSCATRDGRSGTGEQTGGRTATGRKILKGGDRSVDR